MSEPLPIRPEKPRPASTTGYLLFSRENRARVFRSVASPLNLMAALTEEWDRLSTEEQAEYDSRAATEMELYDAAMIAYTALLRDYEVQVLARCAAARHQLDTSLGSVRERIIKMVAELEAHPAIEILVCKIGEPARDEDIQLASEAAGGVLPEGMEQFYRQIGEFRLEWRLSDTSVIPSGEEFSGGCICILPLVGRAGEETPVFGNWEGSIWFEDLPNVGTLKQIRPVDHWVPEACAALYPANPARPDRPPTMHYHYCGQELEDLGISFPEYVALLLQSRGFWYWPLAMSFGTIDRPEAQDFLEKLPLLFPDVAEMAAFLPRIERIPYEL